MKTDSLQTDRRNPGLDAYRQLFEQSTDAHLIIQKSRFIDCNAATVEMLGNRNKSEILKKHPSELSPPKQPDGRNSVEKADEMMALAQEKGSLRFEWDHLRATGEIFPVEVLLTPITLDDGSQIIHTVWRDLSQIKADQEERALSEAHYRSLFQNMVNGFTYCEIVQDEQGIPVDYIFHEVNRAFEQQTKLKRDDVLGKRGSEVIPGKAEDFNRWVQLYGEVATTGNVKQFDRYSPGFDRWFSVIAYSPRKGFFASLAMDITEEKLANEALMTERRRLQNIIEGTNAGTWEWDLRTNMTLINDRWATMLGYTRDEIGPTDIQTRERFTHPEDLERSKKILNQHLAGERDDYECELRMRHKDGHWVWILDRGRVSLRSDTGEPLLMSGTHQDITGQRRFIQLQGTLNQLAGDLMSPMDVQSLGRICAAHLRAYFESDALSIWYLEPQANEVRSVYLEDTPVGAAEPHAYEEEIVQFDHEADRKLDDPLQDYVENRTREELDTQHMTNPFGSVDRMSASILHAPILWEGQWIGVVSIHSYTLDFYSEEDLSHLRSFADLISVALQRALTDQELKQNREELARSLEEKEVLIREIQHRTKNNMNVIIALMNMQARKTGHPELESAFEVTRDRIQAMSLVYDQLQGGNNMAAIDLAHYLSSLTSQLHRSLVSDAERVHLEIDCDPILISLNQAVPVGIALNEIITNAIKHAFPDEREGQVIIQVRLLEDAQVCITVSDDGTGIEKDKLNALNQSLGLRLVKMLIEDQLKGTHTISADQGVGHTIRFKLMKAKG